jgi:hypothetical protein
MGLASIGHHGRPLRAPLRPVRPAVPVLVDLAALFPRHPHARGRYQPGGLQLHGVVTGTLSCWGLCEQGQWWGLVTYEVVFGARRGPVTHWVPAWTLRRGFGDFGP